MNKIIINQEPVLIKTKKYSTIDFSFIYPIKYDKKYLYYPDFLKNIRMLRQRNTVRETEKIKFMRKIIMLPHEFSKLIQYYIWFSVGENIL